jgi:hypothetical protein
MSPLVNTAARSGKRFIFLRPGTDTKGRWSGSLFVRYPEGWSLIPTHTLSNGSSLDSHGLALGGRWQRARRRRYSPSIDLMDIVANGLKTGRPGLMLGLNG